MPHGGYSDCKVEEIYAELDAISKNAKEEGRIAIFGGDWNAEVGAQLPGESGGAVGNQGFGSRNARGDWMSNLGDLQPA
jgi:hypothetical protein